MVVKQLVAKEAGFAENGMQDYCEHPLPDRSTESCVRYCRN
jgi:hypothetical protein